ncbi:hypothetical protein PoB_004066800 [Plakobranchus ocellatus]|uniref:Uncharacterized protein n=1 Tax=Plakobranchus ocellatus TaxID=259542 RepID=A0AAV4B4Z4_9GAST|nr:hypothetical protein PoB_004066800 [Plakobranchus ocellatus]
MLPSIATDALNDDPWVTLVKGVFSQSKTSLNTITEDESRSHHRRKNTWSGGDFSGHSTLSRDGAPMTWVERERGRFGNATPASKNAMGLPNRRSSFGGRRSGSFSVLSAVKEVTSTPGSSTTDIHSSVNGNVDSGNSTDNNMKNEVLTDRHRRVVINSNVTSSIISDGSDEVIMDNPVYGSGESAFGPGKTFDYDVIELSPIDVEKDVFSTTRTATNTGAQENAARDSIALDQFMPGPADVIVHRHSEKSENNGDKDGDSCKNEHDEDTDQASGGSADTFNATLTYSPGHMIRNVDS